MADGSDLSVAHGVTANVSIPTTFDVFVRVRDMCGRPLKGAVVQPATLTPPVTTGDDGLASFPGLSIPGSLSLTAQYTPLFGKTPGNAVISPVQSISANDQFDPTPPGSPMQAGKLEIHTTIFVPVYYPLKRLFSWQNPILRKKIYMDGISVEPFIGAHPKDKPEFNRMLRLAGTLKVYDRDYKALTTAQAEVESALKENGALQKKLGADQAQKQKDQDAHDKKAGSLKPKEESAMQATIGKDQKTIENDIASLDKSNHRLMAANDALTAAQASHGGTTHRQMMEYLVDKALPKTDLDDWIKYGIIHLTGLRYRPTNGCCFSPSWMVYGMREKEIDEREHPSSSAAGADFAVLQQRYAREYLTLLRGNPDLLKSVAAVYPHQKSSMTVKLKSGGIGIKPRLVRSGSPASTDKSRKDLLARLEKLARSDGLWFVPVADPMAPKGAKPPPPPVDLYDLRAVASAVAEALVKRAGATQSAGRPPDEGELLGEIVDRYFHQQIPDVVWTRAMRSTQLLHDFADDSIEATPKNWNRPDAPSEWARVFAEDGDAWVERHQTTMQPFVTGVVCNDVASILARARGLPLDGAEYIMRMAVLINEAGKAKAAKEAKAAALAPATTVEADDPNAPEGAATPSAEPAPAAGPSPAAGAAAAAKLPPPVPADTVGLFRPTRIGDIRRGDIMFVAHWTDADTSQWEAHIVPPQFIVDLGPGFPVEDPDNFSKSLHSPLPIVRNKEELQIPDSTVAFAKQIERPNGKHDRILRAWYRYPKPKTAPKPDDPVVALADRPRQAVYEALTYEHIATVIDVKDDRVWFLETAEPVGIILRPWSQVSNAAWFFGRIPPSKAPDLSWFLNRDNLLSKGRLDDG